MSYEAIYKCGYCGKQTPMSDPDVESAVVGKNPVNEFKSFCDCGHFSYGSSIKMKVQLAPGAWKGVYRGVAQ